MSESQPSPAAGLGQLRRQLVQHFSDNDLRSLCQDLGVDYDGLPGEGTDAKARELITFMARRDRLAELVAAAARGPSPAAGDSAAAKLTPAMGRSRAAPPAAADADIRQVAQIGSPLIRAWRGVTARVARVLQIGGGRIEIGGDAEPPQEPRRP